MTRRRALRSAAPVLVGAAALLVGPAAAQYALDANLRVGGSGVNPNSAPRTAPVRAPIYTPNRATGEMAYRPSAAFNDNTYAIYERYAFDRFGRTDGSLEVSTSANAQRGGSASLEATQYRPTAQPHPGSTAGAHRPSYSAGTASNRVSSNRVSNRVR